MKALTSSAAILLASLFQPFAHAVSISTNGIGEAAVVPYYTVREGWLTTLNLTNESDFSIAVKVRFKEGQNAREVLNFTVALPPKDTFAGVLTDTQTGPVFRAVDQALESGLRTCTVPRAVAENRQTPLSSASYAPSGSPQDDGGVVTIDRAREGHVEFIVMGHTATRHNLLFSGPPTAGEGSAGDLDSAIFNFNCQAIDAAFQEGDPDSASRPIAITAQQFGEPISAIRVTAGLLNPSRGIDVEVPVTSWNHFYDRNSDPAAEIITAGENENCTATVADTDRWEPGGTVAGYCRNLIAAQNAAQPLEPSLNSGFPAVANWWDHTDNYPAYLEPQAMTEYQLGAAPGFLPPLSSSIVRPRFIDALSLTIQHNKIQNIWSVDQQLGVASDWVLTMPTKGLYTDAFANSSAALSANRNGVDILGDSPPYSPFPFVFEQASGDRTTAGAYVTGNVTAFDRTGQVVTRFDNPTTIGPPFAAEDLIQMGASTNVVLFGDESGEGSVQSTLGSAHARTVTRTVTDNPSGWASVSFSDDTLAGVQVGGPFNGRADSYLGLPSIGFTVRQRTFGNVTSNYASSIPHSVFRMESRQAENLP